MSTRRVGLAVRFSSPGEHRCGSVLRRRRHGAAFSCCLAAVGAVGGTAPCRARRHPRHTRMRRRTMHHQRVHSPRRSIPHCTIKPPCHWGVAAAAQIAARVPLWRAKCVSSWLSDARGQWRLAHFGGTKGVTQAARLQRIDIVIDPAAPPRAMLTAAEGSRVLSRGLTTGWS